MSPKIAISCLVDESPKFAMQAWNWLSSLKAAGSMQRADIFVQHTPSVAREHLEAFKRQGANIIHTRPFGTGQAAYCNKIRQLDTEVLKEYDYVLLCDADLFFLACPTRFAAGQAIKAKLVDLDNPPQRIWQPLLEDAGLSASVVTRPLMLQPAFSTFDVNFNGGLYILPGAILPELSRLWEKWARHCLERADLLGRSTHHADQLGFGMAVLEAGWPYEHLPDGANFPTHLGQARYASAIEIPLYALHYHWMLDAHALLKPTGLPWIDRHIKAANSILTESRRSNFDNAIFWDFRYQHAPELGSGLGSRGEVGQLKQTMLRPYMRAISRDRVLDVGCGDLTIMRAMPLSNYLGIDLAPTALDIARQSRPDWGFENTDIGSIEAASFDWAICLDVLIHQPTPDLATQLLGDLVRVSRKGVIVSGYPAAGPNTGIVFSHNALDEALRTQPGIEQVIELGSYRDVTLYAGLKSAALPLSSWDASFVDIVFGCGEIAEWRLLLELVDLSRKQLGFFPKAIIRTIEYPWFAHRLDTGSPTRVLDLGAGVCVLPLWLAQKGQQVVTIDSSTVMRDPDNRRGWNEWGYLDYGRIDTRISSFNLDAQDYKPEQQFDTIYSVSVIEHMPAAVRRTIISQCPQWLTPGGRILISVDLIPGTTDLWPLNGGKTVDADGEHGTLKDVLIELQAAGLKIVETSERHAIAGSRTDLAFIEAVKPIS